MLQQDNNLKHTAEIKMYLSSKEAAQNNGIWNLCKISPATLNKHKQFVTRLSLTT